jgi:hypothetical protein
MIIYVLLLQETSEHIQNTITGNNMESSLYLVIKEKHYRRPSLFEVKKYSNLN